MDLSESRPGRSVLAALAFALVLVGCGTAERSEQPRSAPASGCEAHTYSDCPEECVRDCVGSCEACDDCDGAGSCVAAP